MFIFQMYLNASDNLPTPIGEINMAIRAGTLNLGLVDTQNKTVNGIAIQKLGLDVQKKLLVLLQKGQKNNLDRKLEESQAAQAEVQNEFAASLKREQAQKGHIAGLEQQIREWQEVLNRLTQMHKRQIEGLRQKHAEVMQNLTNTYREEKEAAHVEAEKVAAHHVNEIQELRQHHQKEVEQFTTDIEKARVAHQEEIAKAQEMHQEKVAQVHAARQAQIAQHKEETLIVKQKLAERYGQKMRLLKGKEALRRLVSQYIEQKRALAAQWAQFAQDDAVLTQGQQERDHQLTESSAALAAAKAGQGPETDLARVLQKNVALYAEMLKLKEHIARLEAANTALGGENDRFRNEAAERDEEDAEEERRLKEILAMAQRRDTASSGIQQITDGQSPSSRGSSPDSATSSNAGVFPKSHHNDSPFDEVK